MRDTTSVEHCINALDRLVALQATYNYYENQGGKLDSKEDIAELVYRTKQVIESVIHSLMVQIEAAAVTVGTINLNGTDITPQALKDFRDRWELAIKIVEKKPQSGLKDGPHTEHV